MPALFVTGTDTGVGKTTVCRALLDAAAQHRLRTACMKPTESGCAPAAEGALVPADALALTAACTLPLSLDEVCPYRFAEPVAPGVAADRRGEVIDFARIASCLATLQAQRPDLLLVEGAGGLLVPLGQGRTIRDLVEHLGLALVIVARDALGTINHTLLTVEAAHRQRIEVRAIVLSSAQPGTTLEQAQSNAAEIERACKVPVLARLPHSQDRAALAAAAEPALAALLRST